MPSLTVLFTECALPDPPQSLGVPLTRKRIGKIVVDMWSTKLSPHTQQPHTTTHNIDYSQFLSELDSDGESSDDEDVEL